MDCDNHGDRLVLFDFKVERNILKARSLLCSAITTLCDSKGIVSSFASSLVTCIRRMPQKMDHTPTSKLGLLLFLLCGEHKGVADQTTGALQCTGGGHRCIPSEGLAVSRALPSGARLK